MTDYTVARRHMVDGQVRTTDVTDLRVISAMLEVPREQFMPATAPALAYLDLDVPVGASRRLLRPMVLAKLIQAAELEVTDRVLDVGCATGYTAAVLAQSWPRSWRSNRTLVSPKRRGRRCRRRQMLTWLTARWPKAGRKARPTTWW